MLTLHAHVGMEKVNETDNLNYFIFTSIAWRISGVNVYAYIYLSYADERLVRQFSSPFLKQFKLKIIYWKGFLLSFKIQTHKYHKINIFHDILKASLPSNTNSFI